MTPGILFVVTVILAGSIGITWRIMNLLSWRRQLRDELRDRLY